MNYPITKISKIAAAFFMLCSLLTACNDDFLDQNTNDYHYLDDAAILVTDQTQNAPITISIPDAGNAKYIINIIPKWLTIDEMTGSFNDGTVVLTCSTNNLPEFNQLQLYDGLLVFKLDGKGIYVLTIHYGNLGNPTFTISPGTLNFGSELSINAQLTNTSSSGVLFWQIEDLPSWLTVSPVSGLLQPYESIELIFTRNTAGMDEGDYTANISVFNNSSTPDYQLTCTMHVIDYNKPEILKALEGDVVDVEYNKASDLMAIACKSPDKLYLYSTTSNSISSTDLPATPNCISIADNGQSLLIGNTNATLSKVDVSNTANQQTYTLDCIPYDIVYGSNNWCYVTPTDDFWNYFRSLNLTTGEIIKSTNYSMIDAKTIIKKIPGRDQLLGTRTSTIPSGILLFDISAGIASENINYWHETIDPFWMSESGDKFFCSTNKIYTTPEYTNEYVHNIEIFPIGDLTIDWYHRIKWIDHCEAANTLYVLRLSYSYSYDLENSYVESYNAYNYEQKSTYNPSPVNFTINGIQSTYETWVDYVFASKNGANIYLVKTIKSSYGQGNHWFIEKMNVSE